MHNDFVHFLIKCERTAKEIELSLRVESLELYDEMKLKYQILQRRQFVDESGSITLKVGSNK